MSIIFFSLSLLTMLLFACGRYWHRRRILHLAYASLVLSSLLGWYEYAFVSGLQPAFFIGTLLTALIISFFFYVVYNESDDKAAPDQPR